MQGAQVADLSPCEFLLWVRLQWTKPSLAAYLVVAEVEILIILTFDIHSL